MKVDIFPSLNLPVIYVAQPYGGMDPAQMEGLITNYYEYHFLYINGIHHVESKNVQGIALMKLYFHPGTDMAQAMAETVGYVNRSRAFMPPGTVPPFIMRFDTGSVPVGYLVLSSETKTHRRDPGPGAVQGPADVRQPARRVGAAAVRRQPAHHRRQRRSRPAAGLQPLARRRGHGPDRRQHHQPVRQRPHQGPDAHRAGQRDGQGPQGPGQHPDPARRRTSTCATWPPSRTAPTSPPATPWSTASGPSTSWSPSGPTPRRCRWSTRCKANLPKMQAALPEDIKVSFEFDQSPYVTGAMWGVGTEGLLGAVLTGLMVLLFLRDWRSVIVVVLNIPFALLGVGGRPVADRPDDQPDDAGRPGPGRRHPGRRGHRRGREHPHADRAHARSSPGRCGCGNAETAVPRLLAMLCILAVFIPSFFMEGAARGLFVPLSLAVGFSMIDVLPAVQHVRAGAVGLAAAALPPSRTTSAPGRFSFARLRDGYAGLLRAVMPLRWVAGRRLTSSVAGLLIWLVGGQLGTEIFPTVDAGQFQLRLRAPTGTRIERTEAARRAGAGRHQGRGRAGQRRPSRVGYVGLIPSSYPINTVYLWTSGPEEAVLRVALKPGSGVRVEELKERLREELPPRLRDWLREQAAGGEACRPSRSAERVRGLQLSFEPADIVNEVMSFGSPTPDRGRRQRPEPGREPRLRREGHARSWRRSRRCATCSSCQSLDYPTVEVQRGPRAGRPERRDGGGRGPLAGGGHLVEPLRRAELLGRPEDRHRLPGAGRDPAVPDELGRRGRHGAGQGRRPDGQLLLRDVAQVARGHHARRVRPLQHAAAGEHDGQHRGRGPGPGRRPRSTQALARGRRRRRAASTVDVRGQVVPMQQMFSGLAFGLGLAVVVIFLLLTAYFQSLRLALVVVATVPAVIAGVALALLVDRHDAEHPVVHGGDHGHRRGGGQRHLAGHLRRARPPRGQPTPSTPPSRRRSDRLRPILMTSLRHDRRHGADGPGPGRRRRADRAAGPGGHRRLAGRHAGHAARAAGRVRRGAGPGRHALGVARPRRPGEPPLRPRGKGGGDAAVPRPGGRGQRRDRRRAAPGAAT